jgi:hypothetical protein
MVGPYGEGIRRGGVPECGVSTAEGKAAGAFFVPVGCCEDVQGA